MKRTKQEKLRLGLFFVLVCGFFAIAAGRLVHLQIILSPKYSAIVDGQSSGKLPIPASRGIIYDRSGRVVANNVMKSSLYAYPTSETELRQVAAYVEKVFGLERGTARRKYGLSVERFRWIKRMLPDELADRIAAEAPAGLSLRKEAQREYPYGLIGKQILGFADIDNRGQSGVELSFDSLLCGKQGWADIRRDGLRNTYRVKEQALVKPQPGRSLVLTIDWNLQEIIEEELRQGVDEHNAKSGMAVFVNCTNGEVLAMAHYDPLEKNPHKPVKLRAVSDQFEPGSILKAFTAVGLVEEGLVNYGDSIYCEQGKWRVGRRTVHDDKEHGWLSFREVVELSSNIGIGKFAIMQGGEALLQTLDRFGLGDKTEVGLPGETAGRLAKPSRWSDYNIAALAMGHSVAVNALQMANGFAAIANGGTLYRPQVILGQVDRRGNLTRRCRPQELRAVLSKAAADTLASILRGVVEDGTAEAVNSPVVTIAGKTGTAQIPDIANRRYFWNKYMSSFAGFFPCEKPLVAGIVIYEDPQPVHYGGLTAGPVFRKIAERYSILHPDLFTAPQRMLSENSDRFENTTEIPDLVGRTLQQAQAIALENGLEVRCGEMSGTVVWQYPAADRLAFEGDEVLVVVSPQSSDGATMADLCGLSIKQASAYLARLGIKFMVKGNGLVVKQSIGPGETINGKSFCRLECRPETGGKHKTQRADRAAETGHDKRQSAG
ncbi:MAG: PASTA domain-containing protein [Candidatus Zixiibacteriota bacterium]|nr:MAG: PASTA domain-containing protein [candidate division Zixibacteria bacterium]